MDARNSLPATDLPPGLLLDGRFRILAPLASGGMGTVYRARDIFSESDVALKVVASSTLGAGHVRERFRREAEILHCLTHSRIVQVVRAGEDPMYGLPYIAMEMVRGASLRAWLDDRRKQRLAASVHFALDLVRQVLEALRHAHELTVHRDLKPDNILIASEDPLCVKVIDFGIAWFRDSSPLTATGAVLGTPHYMAPEQQIDSARVDGRADLYALSVILYELLTLRRPVGRFKLPGELRESVPACVDDLVVRGLSAEPGDRWDDAAQMLASVEAARLVCGGAALSDDEEIPGSGSEARQRLPLDTPGLFGTPGPGPFGTPPTSPFLPRG